MRWVLDIFDLLFPAILSCVFFVVVWMSDRTIMKGQPLTRHMRRTLLYGFFFVLGTLYSMSIVAMFGLPRPLWIVFTVAWALLLVSIAVWRYRRARTVPESPRSQVSAVLAEGIPALGLLLCVIAAAVEWEFISKGQGRWWVGLLWLAGVVGSIVAARRNRRTTVIGVLRGVLALVIIGAIVQRTLPALVAAGALGLVLVLLEKVMARRLRPSSFQGSK